MTRTISKSMAGILEELRQFQSEHKKSVLRVGFKRRQITVEMKMTIDSDIDKEELKALVHLMTVLCKSDKLVPLCGVCGRQRKTGVYIVGREMVPICDACVSRKRRLYEKRRDLFEKKRQNMAAGQRIMEHTDSGAGVCRLCCYGTACHEEERRFVCLDCHGVLCLVGVCGDGTGDRYSHRTGRRRHSGGGSHQYYQLRSDGSDLPHRFSDKCCHRLWADRGGGSGVFLETKIHPPDEDLQKPAVTKDSPSLGMCNKRGGTCLYSGERGCVERKNTGTPTNRCPCITFKFSQERGEDGTGVCTVPVNHYPSLL